MKKIVTAIMLAALYVISASSVSAQARITADPNAVGKSVTLSSDDNTPNTDKHLAQKITYEARHKSVLAILTDLQKMTGVAFKAGINDQDWQVRDRKMNIFAKDLPLNSLMNSVARVMKFKWRIKKTKGGFVYRLYMDRKALLDAETECLREEALLEDARTTAREATLEGFSKTDGMSAQEIAQLKSTDPFLYAYASTGAAQALGRFFNEVPAAMEALAGGQELEMISADMSPAGQNALLRSVRMLWKMHSLLYRGDESQLKEREDQLAKSAGELTLELDPSGEQDGLDLSDPANPMARSFLDRVTIGFNGNGDTSAVSWPFVDGSSDFGQLLGKIWVTAMDEHQRPDDMTFSTGFQKIKASEANNSAFAFGEPAPPHADDPALHRKVSISPDDPPEFESVLASLAKSSGLGVVSDSFGKTHRMLPVKSAEADLRDMLDNICTAYRHNWSKPAGVIELRDRYWFTNRAAQIPQAWIDGWRDALEKNGFLDISDLAQIAALSLRQINMNIEQDDVLEGALIRNAVTDNRDLLRLYGYLNDSQRTHMFADGMDLKELSDDQLQTMRRMTVRRRVKQDTEGLRLKAARKETSEEPQKNKSATPHPIRQNKCVYSFELIKGDKLTLCKWEFTTPTYKPREEPAPKSEKPDTYKSRAPSKAPS